MIYLDNASTTQPYEFLDNFQNSFWGNASSLYDIGIKSKDALDYCYENFSQLFNVDKDGIIFTSGATESNNWVLRNIIDSELLKNKDVKPHVMISSIEHPSVTNVVNYYLEKNLITVNYLFVDNKGCVVLDSLRNYINDNTCLVSCMYVNNEVGSIQPIFEIGKLCEKYNVVFHVDATQAIGKIDLDMNYNNIDYLTFSGHKFHGPKGVGGLICNSKMMLSRLGPFLFGGHQQNNFRAGTEDVSSIYNMTKALTSYLQQHTYDEIYIETIKINTYIKNKLKECFNDDMYIINSYDYRIPIFSVSFKDISGEYIVQRLNEKEIFISTGSACTSGDLSSSHVLEAMKCPDDYIQGTIRISFDCFRNTKKEIDILFDELKKIIK